MNWLTHFRTLTVAVGAFTFCCGLVTQILARALGDAPQLGPAVFEVSRLRFYPPYAFLSWTLAWAPVAPFLFVLCIGMAIVCALAAYAIAIVFAKLEPIALEEGSPWRDLASLRAMGHCGLLREEGLALGGLRRHSWGRTHIVRSEASPCIFVGDPRNTDDALWVALQTWRGALVLISARDDLTQRLGRSDALRFAPGRNDTLCFNPLLALRGGPEAWEDGRRLATILLGGADAPRDDTTIGVFALLMFNQLLRAPLEARTLAALRRRLLNPPALMADIIASWSAEPAEGVPPVVWEMARVARLMRSEPDAALAKFIYIDHVLASFGDAGLAHATETHHLNLAQFGARTDAQTLVLSMGGLRAESRSIVYALLAQLVAVCAADSGAPELLIAVEANAAAILAKQFRVSLPAHETTRTVIQTTDLADAACVAGAAADTASIVAIGPQSEASAEMLSKRAGSCTRFATSRPSLPRWRALLFPTWVREVVPRLSAEALRTAPRHEALLVMPDQKPVRMRVLVGGGATSFAAPQQAAPHDWSAPPMEPKTLIATAPATPAIAATTSAAKLRRALTRTSAKPTNKGVRIK